MLGVSKAAISHEDDDGGERSHDASARSIASRTSGCRSSRVISARAVERVVGRKAVDAYVTAIAAKLDLPLRRVVARLAQALQFAGAERRPVALVRLDMIDHRRSLNETALQTKLAQWVLSQLKPAQTLPARGLVEIRPRNRIAANNHHAAPPVRGQPIRAAASNGLNCVVGAAARPITNATVPSMRCVALRLSGARLPAASVRIVVCATHIDRTGLSCISRPSSNSRSRLASAGDIIFVVWANSWKRSAIMLSVKPTRSSDGLKKSQFQGS